MKPALALGLAVACAAGAVALVAADLAFNLVVTLEVQEPDGSWRTLAQTGDRDARFESYAPQPCEGDRFRVTLRNDTPFSATRHMHAGYVDARGGDTVLVDEPWNLAAGASRSAEFEVPASAGNTTAGPGGAPTATGYSVFAFLEERYGDDAVQWYCQGAAK